MKLAYSQTTDDYLAFYQLGQERFKEYRDYRRSWALFYVLLFFFACVLLRHNSYLDYYKVGLVALVIGFIIYWLTPHADRFATSARMRRKKHFEGNSTLEITPTGLVCSEEEREVRTGWGAIGDIITEGNRTYIFTSEKTAYVIPHRRITSGNYVLFMQELARQIEAHTLAPVTLANSAATKAALKTRPASEAETITARRG